MSTLRDGFKVVLPAICLLSIALVSPAVAQHQEARGSVRCESNGPFTRCPAYGSWRGARLVQQLSQKACIQGKTWGFDRNAIWVMDGCRGVFDAGDPYANAGERVTCAGTGARTECPADTRYGVTLVRQVSSTRCVQGSTWGTSQNAIWVDRGCRGEFQVGSGAAGGNQMTKRITCGNPAGQQVTCPTSGSATGVRLVRDLSYGRCQEGQSWGHTDSFIWVNRGCRAEFEVTYRGAGGSEPLPGAGVGNRQITCGSFTNQQVTCKTGGYATSVRLRQDMSGGRCRQGQNWGNTDSFIWTNGGCRGAFEVSYRETGGVPLGGTGTRQITCGTVTIQQVTCKTGGYATSVRLRQDLSGGRCRQGQNWGNTDSFIWANGGCRATFEVTYRGAGGVEPPPAGIQTRQITCGVYPTSQQVTCKTGGNATSVRLVRDLSGGNCRQSQTWGNTDSFIWTNNACRGQFEVTYGGSTAAPTPGTRVISCGDPGGSRVSCNPFGRVASVRLLRDLGGNRCRQGSTWGYTENDIWASQGCYGQFEVSYVATPQPR